MARRASLADLASVPTMDAPVPDLGAAPPRLLRVRPTMVAANPLNPPGRDQDVSDLESMKTGQLQACVVVTRAAFLAIFPEHTDTIAGAEFVVVAGTRRRAAAEQFGLPTLDVVVNDSFAASREQFDGTGTRENIDRKAFAPLEEAEAVDRLVRECGSVVAAAKILHRSEPWVSQRRGLKRLVPALRELLRSGDLPLREARHLSALPATEQEAAWESLCRGTDSADPSDGGVEPDLAAERKAPARAGASQLRFKVSSPPEDIAAKMAETLPREHLAVIVATLAALLTDGHPG